MKNPPPNRKMSASSCRKTIIATSLLAFSCHPSSLVAQVSAPITESGLNTQVSGAINVGGNIQYNITGGTRPSNGANVFHSFGEFGVPLNTIANFQNDAGLPTTNILSRVTGNSPSNIFGTIRTDGFGNANLFLLNPNGVMFGPNASLDLNGSFHVSTADSIQLGTGPSAGLFSADEAIPDMLTTAPPSAFGFSDSNPLASISVSGANLQVQAGKVISIIGGDANGLPADDPQGTLMADTNTGVHISASTIAAPGGHINLVSVAAPGTVTTTGPELTPNFPLTTFTELGSINITDESMIDVRGNNSGGVVIRGGRLTLNNRAQITASTSGVNNAGSVSINVSENVIVTGTENINTQSGIFAETTGDGNAGNITISAQNLELKDGGLIVASSSPSSLDGRGPAGNGAAGDLSITVADRLTISGVVKRPGSATAIRQSALLSQTAGPGDAGNIQITAGNVVLQDGGVITTSTQGRGSGKAGDITITTTGDVTLGGLGRVAGNSSIKPRTSIISSSVTEFDDNSGDGLTGSGGTISIKARNLTQKDGAKINAKSSGNLPTPAAQFLTGPFPSAGKVNLTVADTLTVSDVVNGNDPSEISVGVTGPTSVGDITVNAGTIQILNGGQIAAETEALIPVERTGTISLTAQTLRVSGTDNGNAARRPSGIVARTSGVNDAGEIIIAATNLEVADGGRITNASRNPINGPLANPGAGGNITVTAESIAISGQTTTVNGLQADGSVIESLTATSNDAGNISLKANNINITDGGLVETSSRTLSGTGGNLSITVADRLTISGVVKRPGSATAIRQSALLSRTAGPGDAGNIQITAGNVVLQDGGVITTSTQGRGSGKAGDITITTTGDVTLGGLGRVAGNSSIKPRTSIISSSVTEFDDNSGDGLTGSGGTISIRARNLTLKDGAKINAKSSGNLPTPAAQFLTGPFPSAGKVNLTVADTLTVSDVVNGNDPSEISVGVTGPTSVGDITVNAGTIQILNGGQIAAETEALIPVERTGTISLTAQTLRVSGTDNGNAARRPSGIVARTSGVNNAGEIIIAAANLEVADGGRITNASRNPIRGPLANPGAGGNITVTAESIAISGQTTTVNGLQADGSVIESLTATSNDAGNISLKANNISVTSGGVITANSSVSAKGNAGTIDLRTNDTISVSGVNIDQDGKVRESAINSGSKGEGDGGTITISGENILIQDGAKVSTSAEGSGDPGDIKLVNAQEIKLEGGVLETEAAQRSGGNIKLMASDLIFLNNSQILSSVNGDGTTQGGNINIDPDFIVLINSQIRADAAVGNGGTISLVANTIFRDSLTSITAKSGLEGVDGTVNIQAPIQNLSQAIAPLPETIVEVAALYDAHCAGQKNGEFSSFTQQGLDRIPFEPGELLPTPLFIPSVSPNQSKKPNVSASTIVQRLQLPGLPSTTSAISMWDHFNSGCRS